ncbi:major facilitator superfamily domain-containing protein [Umbelopsis sp. AD052]|nr:major facilitator superfamily domain-containing protein [Umbelopsis sp. AD052]
MTNAQATDLENPSSNDAGAVSPIDTNDAEVYSAFSVSQRYRILAIVATAGFLSTLSANIYFPALGVVQKDLYTTPELINLTVSLFMVFQGLSPSFWAPLADLWGRRPVYLATTTVYLAANIALAVAPNYASVLVLRMLQAFGSGPVVALGSGCIGDIANPTERGTFFGIYTSGFQLAFVFGPVLGGILANSLGWRWIFWILAILAGVVLLSVVFMLRETLRSLVGNGTGYANPTPTQWLHSRFKGTNETETADTKRFRQFPNMLKPLTYAFQPDVGLCLIYNGMSYSVFYAMLAAYSRLLETTYNLNELHAGLCYIPTGIGCIVGSMLEGKILDRDFRIISEQHGYDAKVLKRGNLDVDYPIYKARFRTILFPHFIFDVTLILFGFMVYIKAPLAVILVFQFIFGYSSTSIFIVFHTLLVDLYPKHTASIAASNNIVRCLLGAAMTAAIEPGIAGIGVQYMFLALGLILMFSSLLLLVIRRNGPIWRRRRAELEKVQSIE